MNPANRPSIRKRLLASSTASASGSGEIDIVALGAVEYSAEDPHHPIDNLFDGHGGPGGSYWSAGRENVTETIVLRFDTPQTLSKLVYEVEELHLERTQEVRIEYSGDGSYYWQVLVQQFTFSPRGATFQHEDQRLPGREVTHVRLTVVPNQAGSGTATMVSLRLFREA